MSRPVRVLLLIDSLGPDAGTENQVVEMIRRFDRTQVEIFIGCLEDGVRLQSLARYGHPLVFPTKSVFSLNGLKELFRLNRAINRHAIDVVHTYMIRATIFGVLGSQGSRVRAILTSRRNLGYWYTPGLLRLFRILNRLTTRVIANSKGAGSVAIATERLDPDRVDVIYNGVDLHRFDRPLDQQLRLRLRIPKDAPIVGIIANYRPVKNHALFLKAAQLVARRVPDAVFLMIGRGPLESELRQLAQDLNIGDRVFFSDDQGDVSAFYPLLQVACLSSHSEGFSNAVLEYLAAGLPVVATSVGGVPEIIEHGKNGFLVPAGDAAAMAQAITGLLLDPEQARAMGRYGQQLCQRFELGNVVRQYEQYYRQFLPVEEV